MTEESGTRQQQSSEATQQPANSAQAATAVSQRTENRRKNKKQLTAGEKKAQRERRQAERLQKRAKRQKSWGWRLLRFVFHLLWLPAILAGALALGLIIGYSLLGGEPVGEVFGRDLWQHLYDIIYAEG